jgi:hypothetical protein
MCGEGILPRGKAAECIPGHDKDCVFALDGALEMEYNSDGRPEDRGSLDFVT